MDFQERGRACYQAGDYKKAIEHFDRAIGRAASAQLLDNRAASHEKLGDLSAALKDAKSCIQFTREDATGYLRAGRILIKMQKENVALEIYTHGLKCIKLVGQGYELLRKAHKALMDKLCPPKSVDPFTRLPRELAVDILEYLSFKQRMNACMVSRGWNQFIRSCPDLWKHLDLSNANKKVRSAFISRAINIARKKLTAATLNKLFDFDKTLDALIRNCPLEDLTLLETGFQGTNLVKMLASANRLKRLKVDRGTQMLHADFHDLLQATADRLESVEATIKGPIIRSPDALPYPHLRTMHVVLFNVDLPRPFFHNIYGKLPAVESLTIHQRTVEDKEFNSVDSFCFDQCLYLQYLDIAVDVIRYPVPLKLPSGLRVLKLGTALHHRRPQFWLSIDGNPSPLPKLEELSLNVGGLSDTDALRILQIPPSYQEQAPSLGVSQSSISNLRKLSIAGTALTSDTSTFVSTLLAHPRLRNLEHLSLPGLRDCDDEIMVRIIDGLSQLEVLNLSQTKVTGVGVKHAVKSGHVRELILNDCTSLGVDAVVWARSQGMQVQYRLSEAGSGGRRLRY